MKKIQIKSNLSDYSVEFLDSKASLSADSKDDKNYFIVDANVFSLFPGNFDKVNRKKLYLVDATEENKGIKSVEKIVISLIQNGFKRGHKLIAVGGGIVQDLTCFVATVIFRGVSWKFYPSTLLAQCDSCIGSKSSINVGSYKNQIGTFYPPEKIIIDVNLLKTLDPKDIFSGLGEAIKVHFLDPKKRYKKIFDNYSKSIESPDCMQGLIRDSLLIKKDVIEIDEFDRDFRNIMNYGHTFGHAIESVTNYKIPHGIAVTHGMRIANKLSLDLGFLSKEIYNQMNSLLVKNLGNFKFSVSKHEELFFDALKKDKKNKDHRVVFILNSGYGEMFKYATNLDYDIRKSITEYEG